VSFDTGKVRFAIDHPGGTIYVSLGTRATFRFPWRVADERDVGKFITDRTPSGGAR
jgi:hypothetical protein